MKKVDLVPFSEYDLQNFLSLVNASTITKEDMNSGNYKRKLNSFNQMLEFYRVLPKEVFDPKLEIPYQDLPRPTRLIKKAETKFLGKKVVRYTKIHKNFLHCN